MDDPQPAYRLSFTPDGTSPKEHQGVKRGAALPHNPRTPFQMESPDCGPTAAPRPYVYEHRQARPGMAQAVLHVFPLRPGHT